MKCLESGMNDLAGERHAQLLVLAIATRRAVIVFKMLSQRWKK
ncbi:MAG: hypothetical protein K0S17_2772 [Enterobacter mori]|jgi:hypothetical protein|nr:hypothetical protein [Enterobacter mori]